MIFLKIPHYPLYYIDGRGGGYFVISHSVIGHGAVTLEYMVPQKTSALKNVSFIHMNIYQFISYSRLRH